MKESLVRSMVKEAIIHPFAFAVFPVLSLYVKNMGKGFLGEALGIATGVFILAVLLWLFIGLLVKDRDKSAVVVSAFFVLFFTYGHAISLFSAVLEKMHLLGRARFLVEGRPALCLWLVIWGGVLVAASYVVLKRATDLRVVTKFLNIVALTLALMLGANFFTAGGFSKFLMPRIRAALAHSDVDGDRNSVSRDTDVDTFRVFLPLVATSGFDGFWQETPPLAHASTAWDPPPDIYYIVLDMYARADYLEKIYHYDNSEFLSFLTDKGFYVASKSTSNYPYTTHSLASSLNMMYLDEVAHRVGERFDHFGPSIVMLKQNKLFQFLRSRGYTVVAFSTGYKFTEITDADMYIEPAVWQPSEFQGAIMDVTPLAVFGETQDALYRKHILYTFDHIADATRIDSPAFVFAHVLVPHPPYVFGANGEPRSSKPHTAYRYDEFVEAYRDQLAFVNRRMRAVVEEILSQSSEPPIIIVQSDHGACYGRYLPNIASRMSILNAYYFPDRNYEDLYEDITPVNTFRIVLNNYFGTELELLEDANYYSEWDLPYLFTDTTDKVLVGQKVDHH